MTISESVKEAWFVNDKVNRVLLEQCTSDTIRQ